VGLLAADTQALYERNLELEQRLQEQARELEELQAQLQEVMARLEAPEAQGKKTLDR